MELRKKRMLKLLMRRININYKELNFLHKKKLISESLIHFVYLRNGGNREILLNRNCWRKLGIGKK